MSAFIRTHLHTAAQSYNLSLYIFKSDDTVTLNVGFTSHQRKLSKKSRFNRIFSSQAFIIFIPKRLKR